MSFPLFPSDQDLYTNAVGTVYQYSAARTAWLLKYQANVLGNTGMQGPTGPQGDVGVTGAFGGPPGETGPQGETGVAGASGQSWSDMTDITSSCTYYGWASFYQQHVWVKVAGSMIYLKWWLEGPNDGSGNMKFEVPADYTIYSADNYYIPVEFIWCNNNGSCGGLVSMGWLMDGTHNCRMVWCSPNFVSSGTGGWTTTPGQTVGSHGALIYASA